MIDLAIIPARQNSVGLPGKNLADLGGHPLIAWTIRAARSSRAFGRVIVSTDGEEIASAAEDEGAEVPFLRPTQLATSEATTSDVVTHALDATGVTSTFALLQPTSPFRTAAHIVAAAKRFESSHASSVISVAKTKPMEWLLTATEEGRLGGLIKSIGKPSRRQDASALFAPNGAIYLCHCAAFRESGNFLMADTQMFEMSPIDSIDIDDPEDLELAKAIVAYGLRNIDSAQ